MLSAVVLGIVVLQSATDSPAPVLPSAPVSSEERILGIIPAYHFVEKPEVRLPPLTPREKMGLFVKETLDPFTFFGAAAGAAISHAQRSDPQYGEGGRAFRQRLGAAYIDAASQNFFSDALLAVVFKEDPRYYRLGPSAGIAHRVAYSLSRSFLTRTDSGKQRFNFSSVIGMGMGIGLSNAYYPQANRNGGEMLSRVETSFASSAVGNLLPEFWPDIQQMLAHRRQAKLLKSR